MSKTKSTAKAQEQADEQTPKQTEVTAPASAPAQPAPEAPVSPVQHEAPPTTAETEPPATEPPATEQNAPPVTVAARVLCAGVIGGQRFEAGVVIDGLPSDVADAHAAMLDPHPDAVSHAVDGGAQVVVYGEA